MGAAGVSALVLLAAVLVGLYGEEPIAGLAPWDAALLIGLIGIGLTLAGWIVNEWRHSWQEGLRATLVWSIAYGLLLVAYARQDAVLAGLDRLIGEVAPGRVVSGSGGEVVVARRADGSFTLMGRVNTEEVRFLFDTGASAVVLTAESAAAAGFDPATLSFSVPVATANGRTLAAPITIETLSIGPITERRVRALVARPGVLPGNLLGMTFLERLASYEVRGNRLILRPKGS
ncbi:MAG TPA: TIGR02281 family clan AA aspartic protease [Microvirga sp.]|jgi:aspartyl protease family protein